MPRKRSDYVITTISLSRDQLTWIEKNTASTVSAFVRECVGAKIDQVSGYEGQVAAIDEKIKKAQFEIVLLEQERDSVEQKNFVWKETREVERLSELIAKAIKKIKYSCWQEAAQDLDSARKDIDRETFMALVETIWLNGQNGDGKNVPLN